MRRAVLISLTVLASALAGCGGSDEDRPGRVDGDTLTVYASLPAHGEGAAAGKAAELGMRKALADAGGRAGRRAVRLVVLASTRPGDTEWDPGTIEANAERAVDDATAIAYVGELDQGGSAVSLPVTNRAGILQVSPADGLTSLTRTPPGRPSAGPERYYPEGERNFVRLVGPDLDAARAIVASLRERGSRRLAVIDGQRIADRELESMAMALIGTGTPRGVVRVGVREMDDPAQRRQQALDVTAELVAAQPDAILYAGGAGPEAGSLLAGLARELPSVPVWGGPQLALGAGRFPLAPDGACAMTGAVAPTSPARDARRVLAAARRGGANGHRSQSLLGYDAMSLTLAAIDEGGAHRGRVVAAARRPGTRRGSMGEYAIARSGDAEGRDPVCVELVPAGR